VISPPPGDVARVFCFLAGIRSGSGQRHRRGAGCL